MRESLFRGKRKDNGEWIEASAINNQYDIRGDKHTYIGIFVTSERYPLMKTREWYEVYPETAGQYTGLTDKNGTKIFEGDIVAGVLHWLEKKKNGIVAFRDGSFGLLWYRGDIEQFNPFTSICNVTHEVIGNIHDNPELLKGGGEE